MANGREIDLADWAFYAGAVKNNSKPKRVATPREITRLAKQVNWRDMTLPSGDVVSAETIREVFQDAERGRKNSRLHESAHATAA